MDSENLAEVEFQFVQSFCVRMMAILYPQP